MQRRDFLLGGAAVAWPFAALMLLYCGQADAASERAEYLPPIWGYSLKVTDTLLAAFTFLLFLATCALWYSTKKLVNTVGQTAERQSRAYVYVEKTRIKRIGDEWQIRFRLKNLGQTPAHSVSVAYAVGAVDCPKDKAAEPPVPGAPEDIGSVGPIGNFFEMLVDAFPIQSATEDELRNGTKAIYLVGTVTYDTVFAKGFTTNFRYHVGGDIGWEGPGEMDADETGNDVT